MFGSAFQMRSTVSCLAAAKASPSPPMRSGSGLAHWTVFISLYLSQQQKTSRFNWNRQRHDWQPQGQHLLHCYFLHQQGQALYLVQKPLCGPFPITKTKNKLFIAFWFLLFPMNSKVSWLVCVCDLMQDCQLVQESARSCFGLPICKQSHGNIVIISCLLLSHWLWRSYCMLVKLNSGTWATPIWHERALHSFYINPDKPSETWDLTDSDDEWSRKAHQTLSTPVLADAHPAPTRAGMHAALESRSLRNWSFNWSCFGGSGCGDRQEWPGVLGTAHAPGGGWAWPHGELTDKAALLKQDLHVTHSF